MTKIKVAVRLVMVRNVTLGIL